MKRTLLLLSLLLLIGCKTENTSNSCGDGVMDLGEECDGDDFGVASCTSLGYHGGQLTCSDTCTFITTQCEASGFCGDGTYQPGVEECEGNNLDQKTCEDLHHEGGTLACNDDCTFDQSGCYGCGDGVAAGGEECDGDDLRDETCETLNYHGGVLGCSECGFDVSQCAPFGRCPDGVIQEAYETCDGTNLGGESCESLGYYGGTLICTNNCEYDLSPCEASGWCGDTVVQSNESCDGTNLGDETCETQGHTNGGVLGCLSECEGFDTSGCLGSCGDGTLNPEVEQCDTTGHSCRVEGLPVGSAEVACDDSCSFDYGQCGAFVQVSAGENHTCAITEEGIAYCWGDNTFGQLGNGTNTPSTSPVHVGAGGILFTSISTGLNHTCALTQAGQLFCWGDNTYGQIGDGTTTTRTAPVLIEIFGTAINAVSCGGRHTCALTHEPNFYPNWVHCWGDDSSGQLGSAYTTIDTTTPSPVSSMAASTVYYSISAGGSHTCAIAAFDDFEGAVCWGSNSNNQLGSTNIIQPGAPAIVDGADDFEAVSAGANHTCAIDLYGEAVCWGDNTHGQLGDGTTTERNLPTKVLGNLSSSQISAGTSSSCQTSPSGEVRCWGANGAGELGTGTTTDSATPLPISSTQSFNAITSGVAHSCALSTIGGIFCWGANPHGALGAGSTTDSATPIAIQVP